LLITLVPIVVNVAVSSNVPPKSAFPELKYVDSTTEEIAGSSVFSVKLLKKLSAAPRGAVRPDAVINTFKVPALEDEVFREVPVSKL
jgi:hypothetical protein